MSLPTSPAAPTVEVRAIAAPTRHATEHATGFPLVALCFFLSGAAALAYQTAWTRQFATVFGTSEPAVAAVLAAYMSGLALGAAVAGRWLARVRRPILVYGLLELGIAMGALGLPVGLHLARTLLVSWTGGLPEPPDAGGGGQFAFYLAATFALVLVPTSLMGATLPLLARHAVRTEEQIGRRIGALYAINTVGAVLGTLVAAFVLLPRLGLQGTVWCGVALNALVFLAAVALAQRAPAVETDAPREVRAPFSVLLPLMAVSGAVAFGYEVLWTRLISHFVGGSVYAFATMLASFLTGIALGSAYAARHAGTRAQAVRGFVAAQIGVAVSSILIYSLLGVLPDLQGALGAGEDAGVAHNALLSALVLLPSTLCLGATFPFAVRIVSRGAAAAGSASARVFSWNTVGATLGALAAGFWILPALQFEGAVRLFVLANLALAVVACFAHETVERAARWTAVAGFAAAFFAFRPAPPLAVLSSSPFPELAASSTLEPLWWRVGSSCSPMVVRHRDEYQLRVNGLPQSLVVSRGAPPFYGQHNRWLSALPLLARPDAQSLCLIGLGGGVAVEDLPASVEDIDVIELADEVVEANRFLSDVRRSDPLADPRVRIVANDARSALERTTKRWDVIVSQPSHPWTAGASHLFTREFMQLVGEHLTEDGVFLQWISTRSFDLELLETYGATLLAEFEHVRLYQSSTACPLFLASDAPIAIEETLLEDPGLLASAPGYTGRLGLNRPEDVAARRTLDTAALRELCAGTEPNSDDANRLALRLPRLTAREAAVDMEALLAPLAERAQDARFDELALVQGLLNVEFVDRAEALVARIADPARRAYAESVVAKRMGDAEAAGAALERAQDLDPRDPYVAFELALRELGGEGTERGARAREALSPGGRAAVEAFEHLVAQRFDEVRGYEDELADSEPGEPWHFLALQLRALWRVHSVGDLDERPQLAREALELVDRAIAIGPNVALLSIRAEAASIAGDVDALLESASVLVAVLERQPSTASNRAHAETTQACLARLSDDDVPDPQRLRNLEFVLSALGRPRFTPPSGWQAE